MIKLNKTIKKIFKSINNNLINLPSPINISYFWNIGFLLGISFSIQLIRGLFLSIHYCPNTLYSFKRIIHIIQNVNYGWLIHNIHLNGASLFFIIIYIHIGRRLYYNSFKLIHTWLRGVSIIIISITIAFLGYVLPWGQISFWGATVITNLLSAIPYLGITLTHWIWGGFSINNSTLNRFFSLHFIIPFILIIFITIHIFFLHETGSTNPLGINRNIFKTPFHPYFSIKDFLRLIIISILFILIVLLYPYILIDPDNFSPANPIITPLHIQPEWYFLFAYAILRSIPNKIGGVIALLISMLILYTLPFIPAPTLRTTIFYPLNQIIFWIFINSFITLTILGTYPIEPPFIVLRQITTITYFSYFWLFIPLQKLWDSSIY